MRTVGAVGAVGAAGVLVMTAPPAVILRPVLAPYSQQAVQVRRRGENFHRRHGVLQTLYWIQQSWRLYAAGVANAAVLLLAPVGVPILLPDGRTFRGRPIKAADRRAQRSWLGSQVVAVGGATRGHGDATRVA